MFLCNLINHSLLNIFDFIVETSAALFESSNGQNITKSHSNYISRPSLYDIPMHTRLKCHAKAHKIVHSLRDIPADAPIPLEPSLPRPAGPQGEECTGDPDLMFMLIIRVVIHQCPRDPLHIDPPYEDPRSFLASPPVEVPINDGKSPLSEFFPFTLLRNQFIPFAN